MEFFDDGGVGAREGGVIGSYLLLDGDIMQDRERDETD